MAVGYRNPGNFQTRASPGTSAQTVPVPPGTAAGDLLLLVCTSYVTGAGPVAVNTPAGWTLIAATTYNATHAQTVVFWKVAGASEPSASVTTAASSYLDSQTHGFTGVDTTTPFDVAGTWAAASTSATVTVPSLTTLTGNAWWVTVSAVNAIEFNAGSVPSGWTQRHLVASGSVTVAQYVVNSVLVAAAGATTATSFSKTAATNPQVTMGLALRLLGATTTTTWNGSATVSLTDTITSAGARLGHTVNGSATVSLTATVTSNAIIHAFIHGSATVTELVAISSSARLVARASAAVTETVSISSSGRAESFTLTPSPEGGFALIPKEVEVL